MQRMGSRSTGCAVPSRHKRSLLYPSATRHGCRPALIRRPQMPMQQEARSMRSFSRRAYENGVVIVQCPGCDVRHLVADRLGWFGKPGSVEDFLRQRGQDVQWSAADGSLEMTMEDAKAWAQMSQEQATKAKPAQGNSEVDATSPGKHR